MELFTQPGATVLVDGQFGSTGKGLLASWIAENFAKRITHFTTNAGPNSGHVGYFRGEKILTQQLPVAAVVAHKMFASAEARMKTQPILINAGAIVELNTVVNECNIFQISKSHVFIHPNAAHIDGMMKEEDAAVVAGISGTGKGIGPAQMRKIARRSDIVSGYATMKQVKTQNFPGQWKSYYNPDINWDSPWDWRHDRVFVETAQGFSLGINQSRFYPFTTSRECTVGQAIADARIPAQMVDKVMMCCRTYPIRVGSVDGTHSGHWYPDQTELTWEDIGQPPELTTITKRVRRLAGWSRIQFREAVAANMPDIVFLNFMNYIKIMDHRIKLVNMVREDYERVMGRPLQHLLIGVGPENKDVAEWPRT